MQRRKANRERFHAKGAKKCNAKIAKCIFAGMAYVGLLFYYLTLVCLLFIAIGLWRPWVMLWWEDVSNRRKVIQVYGSIAILFYALYWGLKLF